MNAKKLFKGALLCVIIVMVTHIYQLFAEEAKTIRPQNNKENRLGYSGGAFVFPEGTMSLGDTKCWTKQGLQMVYVVYKEPPNGFDMSWTEIRVDTRDMNSTTWKSLESTNRRNFIGIIFKEDTNQVVWIPFEAVESISVEKIATESSFSVSKQKELYGRFIFEDVNADKMEGISLRATISLRYALLNGKRTVAGMLMDGIGDLSLYNGTDWKKIPWSIVSKINIVRSHNPDISSTDSTPPYFIYRMGSQYANVWQEWSIPVKNTDQSIDSNNK
ncbi:MAG: hypothetical protein ABSB91_08605 [Sedimentisphaerales bacterium]